MLVDHGIRKDSYQEALKVKKLLKKECISLKICVNKKKILKNIQAEARNLRYILSKYCEKNDQIYFNSS